MSEPLKPCPFCGSSSWAFGNEWSDDDEAWAYFVACKHCEARGPTRLKAGTEARAWNRTPAGPTARVRIAVAVTDEGVWGAYSWGYQDGALGKQAGAIAEEAEEIAGPNGEPKHVVWVTADVPLPPEEVQGEVEA